MKIYKIYIHPDAITSNSGPTALQLAPVTLLNSAIRWQVWVNFRFQVNKIFFKEPLLLGYGAQFYHFFRISGSSRQTKAQLAQLRTQSVWVQDLQVRRWFILLLNTHYLHRVHFVV